jgi:hypothetical protein
MQLSAVAIAGFCSAKTRKEHFQYPGKSGTDVGNRGFFEGADQEVQTGTKRYCGGLTSGGKIARGLRARIGPQSFHADARGLSIQEMADLLDFLRQSNRLDLVHPNGHGIKSGGRVGVDK